MTYRNLKLILFIALAFSFQVWSTVENTFLGSCKVFSVWKACCPRHTEMALHLAPFLFSSVLCPLLSHFQSSLPPCLFYSGTDCSSLWTPFQSVWIQTSIYFFPQENLSESPLHCFHITGLPVESVFVFQVSLSVNKGCHGPASKDLGASSNWICCRILSTVARTFCFINEQGENNLHRN